MIKTCKVVPPSPFGMEACSLAGAGITAPVEVVFVLVWLFWLQAVPPWLHSLATASFIQAKFEAQARY